jgi:hypothetical protein
MEEFVDNNLLAAIVGVGGLSLSLAGLIFVAVQVRLLRVQIADAREVFVFEQQRGRKQSSLEFISATMERRAMLQNAIPTGSETERVAQFLEQLKSEPRNSDRRRDLSRFLSYYEAVAVGVNTGVFDIEIIDRAWGSVIIRTFAAYREYIYERRAVRHQPKLYAEFEDLANSILGRRGAHIADNLRLARRPVAAL